jgi:hypothetical protein
MDGKTRLNQLWLLKALICTVLVSLFAAGSQAQILGDGGPPNITVPPVGLSVQNGGTAILTATVTSETALTISWFLNGQPIPTTNITVLNVAVPLVGTVSTLTVNGVTSATGGKYSIVAKNAVGAATNSAVVLVLATTVSNVVSFVSSGTSLVTGGFKIQLSGPTGSNYVIQASSDLNTWVPIYTNTATDGTLTYTDAAAISLPSRYYRAKLQ